MIVLILFLFASSVNADCSNVANEVAQILPGSTVLCEGGRCNLLIEDAELARGGNWDEALQYLKDCERRRLNSITPLTNGNIHQAVRAWLENETSARQTYGDISAWDTSGVTNMAHLFCVHRDCGERMKSTAASFNGDLSAWNVGKVSNMNRMFFRAHKFYSDVSKWDVSKVSTMHAMFNSAYQFNSDVSKWDISKVSTMGGMFQNAYKFNSDVSKWDVSKVSTVKGMFQNAYKFNSDVSKWRIERVENFNFTFSAASSFQHKAGLDSVWEAINPTYYPTGDIQEIMFRGTCAQDEKCGKCGYADTNGRSVICGSSQGGRVPGDTPCHNCWDFGSECCEPFEATDATLHRAVGAFLDSPRDAVKQYGPIEDWDVAQVTSFHRLFDASRNVNAEHFNADISKWNTANVVDMSACFRGVALFDSDLSEWDVSRVRRMDLAFSGTAFNADISLWETPALENISLAFADNVKFNRDLSQWDVRRVNDFEEAFEGASSFNFKSTLDSSWKEQNPTNYNELNMYVGTCSIDASCGRCGQKMSKVEGSSVVCPTSLFKGDNALCAKCEDFGRECCKPYEFGDGNIHDAVRAWLDDSSAATGVYGSIEDWDVSSVTNMYALFCNHRHCGTKKKVLAAGFDGDLSKWEVGKVSTMYRTFARAYQFNSDVSKWDVSKVSTMSDTFAHAYQFNSDVSKWDVSKVSIMKSMFISAHKFNSDVSKWDVSKVSTLQGTFAHAYQFNSDVSKWDVSKVSIMKSMFISAHKFNSDVSKWDVSKVSTLQGTFAHAYQFNSDVSKWDVSKVFTVRDSKYSFLPSAAVSSPFNPDTRASSLLAVFNNAYQFKSDVSKWDVSKVSNMYLMFLSAHNFNSDVSKWDVSKVSTMHAMFGNAYQFNSNILWINLGASEATPTLDRTCFREHAQGIQHVELVREPTRTVAA
eukprot:g3967.t1